MTTEEKQNRMVTFLLAVQILQKEMQATLYEMAQYVDAALCLQNKSAEFIANNIEILDAQFIAASRVVKEDK